MIANDVLAFMLYTHNEYFYYFNQTNESNSNGAQMMEQQQRLSNEVDNNHDCYDDDDYDNQNQLFTISLIKFNRISSHWQMWHVCYTFLYIHTTSTLGMRNDID